MLKGCLELKLQRRVATLLFLLVSLMLKGSLVSLILLSQLLAPAESICAHWQWAPRRRGCSAVGSVGNVRMDLAEWIFMSERCLTYLAHCWEYFTNNNSSNVFPVEIFTNTEEKRSKRSRTLQLSIHCGAVSGKSFTRDNSELKATFAAATSSSWWKGLFTFSLDEEVMFVCSEFSGNDMETLKRIRES